jgi:phage protein D
MAANIAGIRLTLEDGTDLTDKIDPRFVRLSLSERRGGEADELSITLQNADGKLAPPSKGKWINLELGWVSGDDVPIGLVNKGRFRVDEVGLEGPPDAITIHARSADFSGAYPKRRSRTWADTTVGAVLTQIAARNGITASIHPDLASLPIDAIEQHNKSDMAFVQDLGRHFDALATWKNKKLIFMPVGSKTNASGKTLATHTLTRQDGWKWRYTDSDRDAQNGVQAQYHDHDGGVRRTVSTGGSNVHRLKRVYASKANAERAAKSSLAKRQRSKSKLDYDLAVADCTLRPNLAMTMKGWPDIVTEQKWLVDTVEIDMGAGGIAQRVTFEAS